MAKTKAANGRSLPKKRNPLLDASKTPSYNDLVQRRRLGRTDLHVKAAQVGTNSATAPENLGTIEYAYLGAPLPDSLEGSEIFTLVGDAPPPVEYYMMRRSKDGFVSATGMFKVAFPWAKQTEERAERDYLQTLSSTSADEQAGNIWINEAAALALSDEYGTRQWIEALLDPALPSTDSHKVKNGDVISPPPRFEFTAGGSGGKMASPASPARPKKSKKSESPTKAAKPSESPKKRLTKAEKEARAKAAQAASESLQSALDTAASVADSESVVDGDIEGPKINGTAALASPKPKKKSEKKKKKAPSSSTDDDKVVVQVDSTVEQRGDVERTHTNVRVKMPADNPELPMPENTEQMIAEAKKMVEEARKLDGSTTASSSKKGKRKAEQIEAEDDDVAVDAAAAKAEGRELQPAKKARLMEQQARSQRVRSRALMGLAATLTVGAIAPYFLG